ncbi:MAG: hypothetical protein RLZZ299_3183 [Pseudomonadota bacterium]|jgi:hypothetical protein
MMPLLLAGLALAEEAVGTPGSTPPVAHVTVDPLLPQAYRVVPPGVYPCEVDIDVSASGVVTDVRPVRCDEDARIALATAIVSWSFDPATRNGVPVDGTLRYATVFEVRSALPRKHVVGFVGASASVGGAGLAGVEARVHLGESVSATVGLDWDQDAMKGTGRRVRATSVRGDVAVSSRRRHFERRAIAGLAMGAFADDHGASGSYAALRVERMAGPPGLALGGDVGVAALFAEPDTVDDLGPFLRPVGSPFLPWLRATLTWYAPLPRDRFVVVPRAQDPTVYEPEPPPTPPEVPRETRVFEGVRAIHWSEIEPSLGGAPEPGPGFAAYPPGTYDCGVRARIGPDGKARAVHAERCPAAGAPDAEAAVRAWTWPERPGEADVQAVFPVPFFIDRAAAVQAHAQVVGLLSPGGGGPVPLRNASPGTPPVWLRAPIEPAFGMTPPTRTCGVDVDLDADGTVRDVRWVSGDVEVRPRVVEAVRAASFYPVIVRGDPAAVRVRVVLCER